MERLYRAHLMPRKFKEREAEVQNPIVLDNRSFNLEDGDEKTLDYLNYAGTIAKGNLAANGIIKLCPNCANEFKRDYGAIAVPIHREPLDKIPINDEDEFDDIENEWDNIFLNRKIEYSDE